MQDILVRAGCFVAIIAAGHILRKIGFFDEHAFGVLSKIVLKITLPAAIISSFIGKEIDISMLTLTLLGLIGGLVYMALGYLINLRKSRAERAFGVLNLPGYNIGNFTMPFVQSFLGPVGVITTSLFDVGNAFVCLGGSFSVATMIKEGGGISVKRIGQKLVTSVPFMCYIIMTIVTLLKIVVPGPVVSLAGIIGGANNFCAMLMIGVGFRLEANRTQIGRIVKILSVRYIAAALMALCCYFLLPFDLAVRQTLVILLFSPVGSAVPGFTGELKEDVGLSAAINSFSILCSIVIIITLLTVML